MSSSRENLARRLSMNGDISTRQRQVSFSKPTAGQHVNAEDNKTQQHEEMHRVKHKGSWLVYLIFYLLGCGTLLPWNFFITANEYFRYKLQNDSGLSSRFQNYFSIASMGPNLLVMILNVVYLHRLSRYIRICGSLVVMAIMFAITAALVWIDTSTRSEEFFIITLVKMAAINACSSILQGALFGMVVMFPSKYIQAVMAGQGLAGVFASLASIFSLVGQNDVKRSAFGYFGSATVILVISLIAYIMLEKTEFVKIHMKTQSDTDVLLEEVTTKSDSIERKPSEIQSTLFEVVREILPLVVSVFCVFLVTLSVYPSTNARIASTSEPKNDWTEKFFTPVTCFLLFNVGDFVGKTLSGYIQKPGDKGYWLLALCISRALFIPLFVFCNVQPRLNGSTTFFTNDAYPIAFMVIFAITNGYLVSLAVIYAPRRINSKNAELGGTIMAFSIVAGLAAGAGASFLVAPNI